MMPLLLTASIDTRGMRGAMFSAEERERMYIDTLNFYISEFEKRITWNLLRFHTNYEIFVLVLQKIPLVV